MRPAGLTKRASSSRPISWGLLESLPRVAVTTPVREMLTVVASDGMRIEGCTV